MKKPSLTVSVLLLGLLLSAISAAQVNKQSSPFEKFRQSTINELEFRKLQFEVESMRLSLQQPLPSGLSAPHIVGETPSGKLLIEVEVHGNELPQTVEARKDAMMQAVMISGASLGYAFPVHDSGMLSDNILNKWCVIQFFDDDKMLNAKGKKVVDPYIGIYENGELVLR